MSKVADFWTVALARSTVKTLQHSKMKPKTAPAKLYFLKILIKDSAEFLATLPDPLKNQKDNDKIFEIKTDKINKDFEDATLEFKREYLAMCMESKERARASIRADRQFLKIIGLYDEIVKRVAILFNA